MENLSTLAERLQYAHSKSPHSQTSLAEAVGMSQANYNSLLKGKNKTSTHLEKIAKELNVSYQWLLTGVMPEESANGVVPLLDVPLYPDLSRYTNMLNVANNDGVFNEIKLDFRILKRKKIDPAHAYYIPMNDASMLPGIKPHAAVFFDTNDQTIVDSEVYVISHGGILLVRELFNLPLGGIRIRAYNMQDYLEINLNKEQIESENLEIIGKVYAVINFY